MDPSSLRGHRIQVTLIRADHNGQDWDHSPSSGQDWGSTPWKLKSIKILLEKVTQTNTKISSAIHIKEF